MIHVFLILIRNDPIHNKGTSIIHDDCLPQIKRMLFVHMAIFEYSLQSIGFACTNGSFSYGTFEDVEFHLENVCLASPP